MTAPPPTHSTSHTHTHTHTRRHTLRHTLIHTNINREICQYPVTQSVQGTAVSAGINKRFKPYFEVISKRIIPILLASYS